MATTWNTGDTGANITFSNGNKTATWGATTTYTTVRSTNSPAKKAGKWHAEFTLSVLLNDVPLVGIADSTATLSNFCGFDTHGIGFDCVPDLTQLQVFQNNVDINAYSHLSAQGDVIAIEVDIDNKLVWWQDVTAGTGWTNASNTTLTGNPGTGVGGTTFTLTTTGGVMLAGSGKSSSATIIINPGPSFALTPSTGFFPWDATFFVHDTPQFPVGRCYRVFLGQRWEEEWPFTATPNPLKWQGVDPPGQFPIFPRYRPPPRLEVDEQWPFTATPDPLKWQGVDPDPQFPRRSRNMPFQNADEQWPFTATPNPLKWQGTDPPAQFPVRSRHFPRPSLERDEQWPFTAVATPGQFGWDNPERFAQRVRFRPSRSADEEWPFTAIATPGQFGWDNPERFPLRIRWRTFQSADEEWVFTATPNPQSWQGIEPAPQFPVRIRFRPLTLQDDPYLSAAPALTPTDFDWGYEPQFPSRLRFRPVLAADEQWPFTATPTPGQFGWQLDPQFPLRLRFRTFQSADENWPVTVVATPGQFGWQLDPQFPLRVRFRTFQNADEQWPFTSAPEPKIFGVDWAPQFPSRLRFRPLTLQDEQWPFTVTPTPGPLGWLPPDTLPIFRRFQPLVGLPDLVVPQPSALTPTNIDFAYPPEFFTERRRYQPLIYDFWQPDIPIASPAFQIMTASATKVRNRDKALVVTINLQGTGVFVFTAPPAPTILADALIYGSAHIVQVSGSTPTRLDLAVSNDGVNFVLLGPSATKFPAVVNITSNGLLSMVPYCYHAWVVTGGDATTQLAITEVFRGWRY